MKIAIMTQPLGPNYGGIMQAWALQQILKDAGHEPVTLDRRPNAKSALYYVARLGYRALQKSLGRRRAPIFVERHIPYILKNTKEFIGNNIIVSDTLDSNRKLKDHFERENYDAVIVGSDQTWRPSYSPNIGNYFLDFIRSRNIKRIAYASSFGVDDWEFSRNETLKFARLLRCFDAISVRESSGVLLCEKYFGVQAKQLVDPTLLLERERYECLFKKDAHPARNGVYTYILDSAVWKNKVVDSVASQLDKPLYSSQAIATINNLGACNLDDCVLPDVERWLEGFYTADFVVTDSFHGTVFSIIFRKPFISLINYERGGDRFISLLSVLGLNDRLIRPCDDCNIIKVVASDIDFNLVDAKLGVLKSEAISFLKTHLESVE